MPPRPAPAPSASAVRVSGLRKPRRPPSAAPAPASSSPAERESNRRRPNWIDDHVEHLLELIRRHRPKGKQHWQHVANHYNQGFRGDEAVMFGRTYKAIQEKWRSLLETQLPTGCGDVSSMPDEAIRSYNRKQQLVILAHQINLDIENHAGIGSYESPDEEGEYEDEPDNQIDEAEEANAPANEEPEDGIFEYLAGSAPSAAINSLPGTGNDVPPPSQVSVMQTQPSDSSSMPPPLPKTPATVNAGTGAGRRPSNGTPRAAAAAAAESLRRVRSVTPTPSVSSDDTETNRKRYRADSALESLASAIRTSPAPDSSATAAALTAASNNMMGLFAMMMQDNQAARREEREARKQEMYMLAAILGRPMFPQPASAPAPSQPAPAPVPASNSLFNLDQEEPELTGFNPPH